VAQRALDQLAGRAAAIPPCAVLRDVRVAGVDVADSVGKRACWSLFFSLALFIAKSIGDRITWRATS